jgi:hypothetical protein
LINEANSHINSVASSDTQSRDLIRQLQEDLAKQRVIIASNDYERSTVQQRISSLESVVQQKNLTINDNHAHYEASKGSLVRQCQDEISRINAAAEIHRDRLAKEAAIANSKLKILSSNGGDDDPNRRGSSYASDPGIDGTFNFGVGPVTTLPSSPDPTTLATKTIVKTIAISGSPNDPDKKNDPTPNGGDPPNDDTPPGGSPPGGSGPPGGNGPPGGGGGGPPGGGPPEGDHPGSSSDKAKPEPKPKKAQRNHPSLLSRQAVMAIHHHHHLMKMRKRRRN